MMRASNLSAKRAGRIAGDGVRIEAFLEMISAERGAAANTLQQGLP